jgi:integrase
MVFRAPKTAKGKRMIALSPVTCSVLREHLEQQKMVSLLWERPFKDDDLVFSQSDGSPLLPDTVTSVWIRLARQNGLAGVRLHDARYIHASLLLKQGIHPKIVQERLGHASIGTTLDT